MHRKILTLAVLLAIATTLVSFSPAGAQDKKATGKKPAKMATAKGGKMAAKGKTAVKGKMGKMTGKDKKKP